MNNKEIRKHLRRQFAPVSWFLIGYYIREIRRYDSGVPMDGRCLRGFFLNLGFIALALLMGGNMILMI